MRASSGCVGVVLDARCFAPVNRLINNSERWFFSEYRENTSAVFGASFGGRRGGNAEQSLGAGSCSIITKGRCAFCGGDLVSSRRCKPRTQNFCSRDLQHVSSRRSSRTCSASYHVLGEQAFAARDRPTTAHDKEFRSRSTPLPRKTGTKSSPNPATAPARSGGHTPTSTAPASSGCSSGS